MDEPRRSKRILWVRFRYYSFLRSAIYLLYKYQSTKHTEYLFVYYPVEYGMLYISYKIESWSCILLIKIFR